MEEGILCEIGKAVKLSVLELGVCIGLRVIELQSHFQEECRQAVLTCSSIKSGLAALNESNNPPLTEYSEPSSGVFIGNDLAPEDFYIHMNS